MMNADYSSLNIENKDGNNNIVTKYDKHIQEYLKKNLLKPVPNALFVGEENDEYKVGLNKYTFIVDPIDGTTNFSRKLNMSAISVALLENDEPIVGICYIHILMKCIKLLKMQEHI